MTENLTYFSQPGMMTDPGVYTKLLEELPTGMGELCKIVQGTTIHIFWAERYGLSLSGERKAEVQLRSLQRRLRRTLELDPRPLTEARPLEKKIVGNCRDFSVLLVSILRHQGIPARPAAGLAHTSPRTITKTTGWPSIGMRTSTAGSWWMPNWTLSSARR